MTTDRIAIDAGVMRVQSDPPVRQVRLTPIGPNGPEVGMPAQMTVFSR